MLGLGSPGLVNVNNRLPLPLSAAYSEAACLRRAEEAPRKQNNSYSGTAPVAGWMGGLARLSGTVPIKLLVFAIFRHLYLNVQPSRPPPGPATSYASQLPAACPGRFCRVPTLSTERWGLLAC